MTDLDRATVRRGTTPTTDDGPGIDKTALAADKALVVFSVQSYAPQAETQYGMGPAATLDVLVLSGRRQGARDRDWRVFGNLARQSGTQPVGVAVVARVVSGPAKTPGSVWYGLDFDVTDAELDTARRALASPATNSVVTTELNGPARTDQPAPF